jgi:histidinol-phosphate aminotransferase
VPPECIVASSGSEQLIDLIVDVFLEKGNSVISVVPSFFMYQKRVKLKKADFLGVPLNRDLSLSPKAILEAATSKTRLLFICSPNNPTGNQFDYCEIEALASKTSAILVLDEAYAEFAGSSFASLAVKKKNVIVLRTFSKGFGLAGLRFGYAVANPDLARSLSNVIPYTVSTVTSKFVVNLLKSIDAFNESLEMAKAERKRLIDKLNRIKGIKVFNSDANFVTFKPKNGADAIHQKLLQQGILIKNLGDLPVIGHCLRVTVGLPEMNDRFISALSEVLEQHALNFIN